MTEPLMIAVAEAIGNHLSSTKDINQPIGSMSFHDLLRLAETVLNAWQHNMGCTDEYEVPYE